MVNRGFTYFGGVVAACLSILGGGGARGQQIAFDPTVATFNAYRVTSQRELAFVDFADATTAFLSNIYSVDTKGNW